MLSITPSVQSPAGYDAQNLTALKISQRLQAAASATIRDNIRQALQDSGYRHRIAPWETSYGLTEADLTFGYDPGNVKRYGAVGDGATDDTDAIETAHEANDGHDVTYPPGTYIITRPIGLWQQTVTGLGAREPVRIHPRDPGDLGVTGNFPAFVNDTTQFICGALRNFLIVYGDGSKPSNSGTHGDTCGVWFKWWDLNKVPNYYLVEDVEIRGAWWGIRDEDGTYGGRFERCFAWNCKNGFRKIGGTTTKFRACITLNTDMHFFAQDVLAIALENCAGDGAAITDANGGIDFRGCKGFSIQAWDSESNDWSGNDAALFRFNNSTGVVSGVVGYNNTSDADGGYVAFAKVEGGAVHFEGIDTKFNSTSWQTGGTGTYYGILATDGAKVSVAGSNIDVANAGTGTPTRVAFHATGTARIEFMGCAYDGSVGNNAHEVAMETGTFTATLTGCTSSPTGDIRYTRNGNLVTLRIPQIAATSNTTAATLTGTLPTHLRPQEEQTLLTRVVDNTVVGTGLLVIAADGSMTLLPSPNGGNFTAAGTKGVYPCTVTYTLEG